MTIDEIIDIEKNNSGVIHLFRSGLFFRAFERSALGFLDIENYQIIKKHSVKLNVDYIYVGFPSAIVDRLLESRQYTWLTDDHIVIESRSITNEELEVKKSGFMMTEPKTAKVESRRSAPPIAPSIPSQDDMFRSVADIEQPATTDNGDKKSTTEITALIKAFDIDNSTPMMCQTFLSMIKEKINRIVL